MIRPFPKPLPFVVPPRTEIGKPSERLPERKRMTLVAALAGAQCGVMLADSQETISGYAKKSVDKLTYWGSGEKREFRFALGGASNSGPYIDMLNFELSGTLLAMESSWIGDICKGLEKVVLEFHEKHIWPQRDQGPQLETLIMVQPQIPHASDPAKETSVGSADLIHIHQTAVNPLINESHKSIGVGSYLADYLLEKLAGGGTESHLIATAVYILQQAKLHVDGVGLNGKLVLFASNGDIIEYDQEDINPLEQLMDEFNEVMAVSFREVVDKRAWMTPDRLIAASREFQDIKARYIQAMADIPKRRKEALDKYGEKLRRLGA